MEGFYESVETSLLALGLVLGLAVATLAAFPTNQSGPQSWITLPMIEVVATGDAERAE